MSHTGGGVTVLSNQNGVGFEAFADGCFSAERVLQSLEQKGDGNDGMSSGEESDLYRQLQETGDIYRSRYKVSCVTVLIT